MKTLRLSVIAALAAACCILLPARPALAEGESMRHELHAQPLVIDTAAGERVISIEIADEAHERSHGLMFRHEMPEDRGLLFIFERTGRQAFWMKNTPLPLDLLFIGENGRVVAIRQGEPYSETSISPESPSRFVLELNQGTAARLGITIGTRLQHPVIHAISGRK